MRVWPLDNGQAVPYKTECELDIRPSNCTAETLSQTNGNLSSCQNLYMSVHCSGTNWRQLKGPTLDEENSRTWGIAQW